MKQKRHLFCVAFFSTMIITALSCGFAVADRNTRQGGLEQNPPMVQMRKDPKNPLIYHVSWMGGEYLLSLDWLNTAVGAGQKLFVYAPAKTRLGVQLVSLAAAGLEQMVQNWT